MCENSTFYLGVTLVTIYLEHSHIGFRRCNNLFHPFCFVWLACMIVLG